MRKSGDKRSRLANGNKQKAQFSIRRNRNENIYSKSKNHEKKITEKPGLAYQTVIPNIVAAATAAAADCRRRSKGTTLVLNRIFLRRETDSVMDDLPVVVWPPDGDTNQSKMIEQNLHVSFKELPPRPLSSTTVAIALSLPPTSPKTFPVSVSPTTSLPWTKATSVATSPLIPTGESLSPTRRRVQPKATVTSSSPLTAARRQLPPLNGAGRRCDRLGASETPESSNKVDTTFWGRFGNPKRLLCESTVLLR